METRVPRPPFARARVVGGGVEGIALAVALRERAAAGAVDLVDADPRVLDAAKEAGLEAAARVSLLPESPDAVFLAGSTALLAEWARLAPGALIQELAEVQCPAQEAAARASALHPDLLYVGAHPLCYPGDRGRVPAAERYLGLPVALCPLPEVPEAALASAEKLWRFLGAVPVILSAEEHDAWMALTSHLPFVAASALAALAASRIVPGTREDLLLGPAFLAGTRMAQAPTGQWARILADNGGRIAPLARALARSLEGIAALLDETPSPRGGALAADLERHLAPAAEFRRRLGDE